jgi:spermidine synthase
MIYEINGSRIVSPFIGTSTYVWTSLIGVILAALSLGYWLGGSTADKKPDIRVLAAALFAAGGLVSATVLFKDFLLSFIAAVPLGLELRSVLAALFLFAPASVALGFVVPYAAKLRLSTLDEAGRTVGRLYALSTIGSIVGTFAAGFFLIPFVGSTRTLYCIAAILFLLSILIVGFQFTRLNFMLLTLFAFSIISNEMIAIFLERTSALHDLDTEYNRVRVFETHDPKTNRKIRAMAIDPYYVQSAIYLDSEDLALEYSRFYKLVEHFNPGFRHSLMIGGAGYTYPMAYLDEYPEATIDVVEIDSGMTEIARKHFRLREDIRLRAIHRDGREFLRNADGQAYDAVFIDAFSSLFSVPYQLTTVEAVREIDRVLRDDGVVIFNLGSAFSGPASLFLQAEIATYRKVFPQIYLFKVNSSVADDKLQNVIVVASQAAVPVSFETDDELIAELLSHRSTVNIDADADSLTDDLAPVEYFGAAAQRNRETQ